MDSFLEKKLGLKADSCVYKSNTTQTETSFPGLGECLYFNMREGFKTDIVPGLITARVMVVKTQTPATFQIVWRPARGSGFHVLDRLYKDWRQQPDTEDRDGLVGELKLIFPDGPVDQAEALMSSFGDLGEVVTAQDIRISEIYISAMVDENNPRVTNTSVLFYKKGDPNAFYGMKISSDFNFLNRKKTFHVEVEGQ